MPLSKTKIFGKIDLKKAYLFCLLFYAALLPMQPQWLPITLGIMLTGLFWLLSANFKQKFQKLLFNPFGLLLLCFYVLIAVSAVYSDHPDKALSAVGKRFPYFAWALLLGTISMPTKYVRLIIRVFILSTAVAILISFADSVLRYLAFPVSDVFFFNSLTAFKRVPPHYFGLFVNFSYALVLIGILNPRKAVIDKKLSLALLLLFFISIPFIAVRMQYLVLVVITMVLLFYGIREKQIGRKSVMITSIIGVFFLTLLFVLPESRMRVMDTYNELRSFKEVKDDKQTNPRKYLWNCGLIVINENFLFGTGIGSENKALNELLRLERIEFWNGTRNYFLHEKKYNYHNVYLQAWAAQGVIGLVSLIALFVVPFFYRKELPFYKEGITFLLICAISFLTESMLQRQAGILFFSFFYSVFFVLQYQDSSNQS